MRRSTRFGLAVFTFVGGTMAACTDEASSPPAALDAGSAGFDANVPPSDAGSSATPDTSSGADADAKDATPPALDFFTDFEGAMPAQIDPGTGLVTDTQGYASLGPAGKTFATKFLRSETANVVKVALTNLPPHKTVTIAFLFAAIDSLDGTGSFPAGDFFKVTVDGAVVMRESFANATDQQIQSYVAPLGGELARRVDLGFQGPGGYYTDSAYDMAVEPKLQKIAHTASTLTVELTIEGEGNQSLDDESWAIDNVHITSEN